MRSRPFLAAIGVAAAVILAFCLPPIAVAAEPAALVADFEAQARALADDPALTPADRQQRFHVLADRTFDFPLIARYVLGRYWQTTADEVRQDFARTFEDYMIDSYGSRMDKYSGAIAAGTSVRAEGEHTTIVVTKFAREGSDEPTTVEWRVQATPDGLKVTDVSVSGVSLAVSYRDQFAAAMLRNGGEVAALIPELRDKLTASSAGAATIK
jgi:phospholipid transport system substrate-binding protein